MTTCRDQRSAWATLYASGRANHGVVTVAMAVACGIARATFYRRANQERWRQPFRGVFLLPGAPLTHAAKAAAVIAGLGDRFAVSHESALFVHGLGPEPADLHLTLPSDRRSRPFPGITIHRSATLVANDVARIRGLPVTAIARTLRDVAGRVGDSFLYDVMTEAERLGLVDLATLQQQAGRQVMGAGAAAFAGIVRQRHADRSESALERDTVAFCRAHGFAPHPGPYPLTCHSGRVLHLDVAFVPIRHTIECDGVGFHSDRRAFEVDRLRWGLITSSDWTITWVTRKRLRDDPEGILDELRRAHLRARS
jgi:hypothetical protein